LVEAITFLGVELGDIRILSLGTTTEVTERPPKLDRGGLWQWKEDATEVFLRGQSLGASNAAENLVGIDHFMRIDPTTPARLLDLDRVSTEELLGRAHDESKHRAPEFKRKFMGHVAAPHVSPHI
jgi:hypothetical protein